nr:MBOAT family protein [Lachnospiraceae bacterium]
MLFNSIEFLFFFPIVVLAYFIIPKKVRYIWLLLASYVFYMGWNAAYALLLLASTVVTYLSGLLLDKVSRSPDDTPHRTSLRKLIVALSCIISLGILFFYKYFTFALSLVSGAFALAGISLNVPTFDIILPVGISFYTFQALSYTIDVYRGDIPAERNFLRYALFVSFFPQLVAGPIERSRNLLTQMQKPTVFDFDKARDGFLLMLWGYFLKIVLADRIAVVVDTVYDGYEAYSGWYFVVATVLFAIQIYCDFSGYSAIAIGAARILGFDLMDNFDAPYTAISVAEYWRRWHISLTTWFKDYLYIPLGGNRKGRFRKYINIMIVFLTSGLWHGASLHFVFWGGLNGLYQIIGECLLPLRTRIAGLLHLDPDSFGYRLGRVLGTFFLVDVAFIFFRADRIRTAFGILGSIIRADNPWIFADGSLYALGLDEKNFHLMLICIVVLIAADVLKRLGYNIRGFIVKQDYIFRWIVIAAAIVFILTFGLWGSGYDANNFIYFQF